MSKVKIYPICGGHHHAYEDLSDGTSYFMTQEGISIHHSIQDVYDCLDANKCSSFVGKLDIKSKAIPVAKYLLTLELPIWAKQDIQKHIDNWTEEEKEESRPMSSLCFDFIDKTIKVPKLYTENKKFDEFGRYKKRKWK